MYNCKYDGYSHSPSDRIIMEGPQCIQVCRLIDESGHGFTWMCSWSHDVLRSLVLQSQKLWITWALVAFGWWFQIVHCPLDHPWPALCAMSWEQEECRAAAKVRRECGVLCLGFASAFILYVHVCHMMMSQNLWFLIWGNKHPFTGLFLSLNRVSIHTRSNVFPYHLMNCKICKWWSRFEIPCRGLPQKAIRWFCFV